MQPISIGTCEICGEGMAGLARLDEIHTCAACREARPRFQKACAYGAYDGELRQLIHLLKYEQVTPAANLLGEMLAVAIEKLEIPNPVLMVPVPLHFSKRRGRGFNQAELIARAALKRLAMSGMELAADLLVRQRITVSQIGLTRPQRAENIRGPFWVEHPEKIAGRCVLLVDDVLRTGTTASECARVLGKAGAEKVWVATVARTLKQTGQNFAAQPDFEIAARAS
jgi:ComF family protein